MKILQKIGLLMALSIGMIATAQQTPAPAQKETITITGATAHLGNGTVMENSVITFENGKITMVGGPSSPLKGTVINAQGKHLYPGFIAPAKSLGLVEVDAVRATDDQDELGDYIPNIRSIIAYNAESKVVESMRPNGVLLGQIAPQGGMISGTSSVVQFDAWNWEDAAVKVDDGVHLNWPNSFRRGRWWMGEDRGWSPNKEYQEDINKLKVFIANAKAYGKTDASYENEGFKNMQGLFDGTQKLYVYANGEKEMIDAVSTAKESGIQHVVIVGGYQADKIIPFLKQNDVAVLVRHTHSLPFMEDDDYDFPYKLPKLLVDGGLLVAIQNSD
ncbi:MAG: amidohydrolase, partial [Altibacter sp.]|nr:amidohydrolase [Altibacter sp.]